MAKKTSLKDIAQAVGVSTTLVSYVLNNQKENRIGKEVAKRIRDMARLMNYQPNQIARSLKTNKTYTIGLLVADIANSFSSSLARIIEDEADKQNYTVLFGSSDESLHKSQKLLDALLNRQVDGLLIAAAAGAESQLLALQQQRVPFVLIDRYFPALSTSYVALDNYKSVYDGVQHLIAANYRRIGMISFKTDLFHLQERIRGYRASLSDNSLPVTKSWLKELDPDGYKTQMSRKIHELLEGPQPVDAIVFASNTLTLTGLQQLNAMGLRTPDDVGILGFDEAEAYDLFTPPLSYIRQPLPEMGQLATRLLLEMIQKNNRVTQANLEAELIIRGSTQPRPEAIVIKRD